MKNILPAVIFALATFGMPGNASAQMAPENPSHPEVSGPTGQTGTPNGGMPNRGMDRGGMSHGGMDRGDMDRGDMHRGDMHRGGMGGHHGWHRHCMMRWHHHHHVRVCR